MTVQNNIDVLVLGAGIVGVSAGLHLQRRGLSVALVDRRDPGEETSYGNAGIIVRETVEAHGLPETFADLFSYALNLKPEARYDWRFLPRLIPFLAAMRRLGGTGHDAYPKAMVPLGAAALGEHEALMRAAGAGDYLRKEGWLRVFRSRKGFEATAPMREAAAHYGIESQVLTPEALSEIEPHIAPVFHRAVMWPGTATVSDPGAVTKAYARHFSANGGAVLRGDALSLRPVSGGWQVTTADGEISAPRAVVALGPWSPDVLEPLGLSFPFIVERGYHRHFAPRGNAVLGRPVLDADIGYVLAPMTAGIRLTTGVEFADRDAPKTPVQLARVLPKARELFPLGEAVDDDVWLGCRPTLADGRPIIGPAPGRDGLFLAFGHAHLGFTLGPITGRLVAEAMTGETPAVDLAPFAADRF